MHVWHSSRNATFASVAMQQIVNVNSTNNFEFNQTIVKI